MAASLARLSFLALRVRLPAKIIDKNSNAEQEHPNWEDEEAPLQVAAPKQKKQRQRIAEKPNVARRKLRVDDDRRR